MTKIIYFFLLLAAPFIVITVVHAAPVLDQPVRPKKRVLCGDVYRAETKMFKSTPVIYMVAKDGGTYTLYAGTEATSPTKFLARLEVIENLKWVDSACLAGTALKDIFFPDGFVDPQADRRPVAEKRRPVATPAPAPAAKRPQTAQATPPKTDELGSLAERQRYDAVVLEKILTAAR